MLLIQNHQFAISIKTVSHITKTISHINKIVSLFISLITDNDLLKQIDKSSFFTSISTIQLFSKKIECISYFTDTHSILVNSLTFFQYPQHSCDSSCWFGKKSQQIYKRAVP